MPTPNPRHIAFLTGTRAEFGLMESTLRAIQSHPSLRLSILATGMHLDPRHGRTINHLRRQGWKLSATIPWRGDLASATGQAVSGISKHLARLHPDLLLVVGDRVEAFAGATAAHLSGIPVAHVHGGDRALGQVDDSLRHAITKLSHLHFPATAESATRLRKLGEDPWRIHPVGSPGLDGIKKSAAPKNEISRHFNVKAGGYALLVLHPIGGGAGGRIGGISGGADRVEEGRARGVLDAVISSGIDRIVIIYPNNDPGSPGIIRVWQELERAQIQMFTIRKDIPRPLFLGLMRDAAVLVGNSSSGIIEAASFGTRVINIGPRQQGRQHTTNVTHTTYDPPSIRRAIDRALKSGKWHGQNPYGHGSPSIRIAQTLASQELGEKLLRKLITY